MPIIPHTSSLQKPTGLQTLIPVSTSGSDKLRSSLLESFRSNQVSVLSLGDLSGHVLEFSQDQHGSRFIQQKLETATTEEKSRLWEEVAGSGFRKRVIPGVTHEHMMCHESTRDEVRACRQGSSHTVPLAVPTESVPALLPHCGWCLLHCVV